MIPILLVSRDKRHITKYLNDFVREHEIHPSRIFHYYKDPNVISIDQIRDAQSLITRVDKNMYLIAIHDFETAKEATQNAFLKTLEEHVSNVQFILMCPDVSSVLSTILSRAKTIRLRDSKKLVKLTYINKLALNNRDSSKISTQMLSDTLDKDKALKLCDELLQYFHETLHNTGKHKNISYAVKEILTTKSLITLNNLNYEFALDHLMRQLFVLKVLPL